MAKTADLYVVCRFPMAGNNFQPEVLDQVGVLRQQLLRLTAGQLVRVVSTPSPATVSSARLLGQGHFSYDPDSDVITERGPLENTGVAVAEILRRSPHQTLVLVTGQGGIRQVMRQFCSRKPPKYTPRGSLWLIDISGHRRHRRIELPSSTVSNGSRN